MENILHRAEIELVQATELHNISKVVWVKYSTSMTSQQCYNHFEIAISNFKRVDEKLLVASIKLDSKESAISLLKKYGEIDPSLEYDLINSKVNGNYIYMNIWDNNFHREEKRIITAKKEN